jgi:hypothetical protein
MAASEGTEVVLHLYDLSMGMARGMSMMFIGKQIDWVRSCRAQGRLVKATSEHPPPATAATIACDVTSQIPHTGIVLFGHEFFFSGGIQVRSLSTTPDSATGDACDAL